MDLKTALYNWATAHEIAKENSTIMTEGVRGVGAEESTRLTNLCAERMENVFQADKVLHTFRNSPDLPQNVKEYFDSIDRVYDNFCKCHFQSYHTVDDGHEECRKNFENMCDIENALIEYVLKEQHDGK